MYECAFPCIIVGWGIKFHLWTNFTAQITLLDSAFIKFRPKNDPKKDTPPPPTVFRI